MINNSPVFAKKKKHKKAAISTVNTKEDIETQGIFISGVQAYLNGNYQEAITKFNQALQRDPNIDAAYYELSRIAYESGNMEKATENAQKAIDINPDNEYYYQYLAEAKGASGDYVEAANVYKELIKRKPKEYNYYYDWAYMLTKAEKYKEAIDVYNQLEQKTGVQEDLIFQKQPLYIKLGKVDDCIKDIEKLAKEYPEQTRYIALIGEVYKSNKMYDKAIDTYERILAKEPNNANALLSISESYLKLGNTEKYKAYQNQLFNSDKIDIDTKIYTLIPLIHQMIDDSTMRPEVLNIANKLVEMYPDNVKTITARADVLYNSGNKLEAQKAYSQAVKMSDVPTTVWVQLYILDAELEDYKHLIEISNEGIQKNPEEPYGYFYNSLANQLSNNYQQASDVLLKSFDVRRKLKNDISVYPPQLTLQMLINLGDVSFQLKNYARSDSAYDAALEIDPNSAIVLNNYAYYLSERDVDLEKAERMSKKSNLLEDDNSAYLDTYAWIMYKMKNYKEALEWIEQALQLPDANNRAELLQHYGDILYKSGKIEKAVEQWNLAIQKGGDKIALEDKIKNARAN